MTEELAIEVIWLRKRLREAVLKNLVDPEALSSLGRLQHISAEVGDEGLRFEHARWSVQIERAARR